MRKLRITVSGQVYEVEVEMLEEGSVSQSLGNSANAPTQPVQSSPEISTATAGSRSATTVPSPLSGTVVSITVTIGQVVKEEDNLIVLEAMKMNSFVSASSGGVVKEILVNPGDSVDEGQALIVIG